jgi:hypothetical protein
VSGSGSGLRQPRLAGSGAPKAVVRVILAGPNNRASLLATPILSCLSRGVYCVCPLSLCVLGEPVIHSSLGSPCLVRRHIYEDDKISTHEDTAHLRWSLHGFKRRNNQEVAVLTIQRYGKGLTRCVRMVKALLHVIGSVLIPELHATLGSL